MARAEFEWFQWSKERESAGPNMLVSILGPQSVGKTTLAGQLEDKLGFHLITEEWKHLAYLIERLNRLKARIHNGCQDPDVLEEAQNLAFNLEVELLTQKIGLEAEINGLLESGPVVIDTDRVADGIYAEVYREEGLFRPKDFQTYAAMQESSGWLLPFPNLLICLRISGPVLVTRWEQRGRGEEKSQPPAELERYAEVSNRLIAQAVVMEAPVLVIDTDSINYAENLDHQALVLAKIRKKLDQWDQGVRDFAPEEITLNPQLSLFEWPLGV